MSMVWRRRTAGVLFFIAAATGCGAGAGQKSQDAASDANADASLRVTAAGKAIRNSDGGPIANAKACVLGHPEIPCATSDDDGNYIIEQPDFGTGLDVAGNLTALGFLGETLLVHQSPPGVVWINHPMRSDAEATELLSVQAGFTYPASGKGFVLVSVFHGLGGAYVGQTLSVSPAPEHGAVYTGPTGTPDPSLTAITINGYALFGGLSPGKIEITTTGPPCTVVPTDTNMWVSSKPHTIAGEVAADSITRMSILCAE